MTEMTTATDAGWLAPEEMDAARERLPILYVDVVPVRVDVQGTVTAIGLLLRAGSAGQIKRALVAGRGLYHERDGRPCCGTWRRTLARSRCRRSRPRRSRSPSPTTSR